MSRVHYRSPIQDESGNLLTGSSVRVMVADTTEQITDALYTDDVEGAETLTNPWVTEDGIIDFYLDRPRYVRIGVTPPGAAEEIFFEDVEVGNVQPLRETFPFTIAGAVTVQEGRLRLYFEEDGQIERVRVSAGIAPSGADLVVDVNVNGSSIFADALPTVVAGENTGLVNLPTPLAVSEGDYLTIDVDQVGSTTPGADVVVQIWVRVG